MKKKITLALIGLLSAPLIIAQEARGGVDIPLFSGRDLTETAYTYCATFGDSTGVAKEPWKVPDPRIKVVTSGSSTTVAAHGATGEPDPFTNVAVGDELRFIVPAGTVSNVVTQTTYYRYVTARASASSITVNSAIDLGTTGLPFNFRTLTCGTSATSGMIATDGFRNANFQFEYTTKNATSIDWRVECQVKGSNTGWVIVIPSSGTSTNLTAVAATSGRIFDVSDYDYCRLGMQVNTDTGTNTVNGAVRLTR
jgi:hypothetical protein